MRRKCKGAAGAAPLVYCRTHGRGELPPSGGGDAGAHRLGQKGEGHRMVPLPPLDSPKPSLGRDSLWSRVETGEMGLGSVRFSAYMWLSCPEFRLRGLPRIPVRGHSVQGGRVLLRKAPLPSRVYPWSTRRHCGPLAFRCATEGSRSAKEGKGSQEGTGNHMVSCPLLPLSVGTDTPGPPKAAKKRSRWGISSPSASKMQEPAKTLICACA